MLEKSDAPPGWDHSGFYDITVDSEQNKAHTAVCLARPGRLKEEWPLHATRGEGEYGHKGRLHLPGRHELGSKRVRSPIPRCVLSSAVAGGLS